MENIGALALLLAFCISLYAIVSSVVGRLKNKPFLILSGERAMLAVWFLITAASGILVYALMTGDFRFAYVASHTNKAMSPFYKFGAWWGGQEGSLLFWSWLLSCYGAVVVTINRKAHRNIMPWVVAILSTVQLFFLLLNCYAVSPFQVLAEGHLVVSVPDGMGLSPLLQYWAMVIHPPMLYLGYVGFAVPFAFAMGSLIAKAPGDSWIHTTRRWTVVTWLFQSVGITLGAAWAYHVLGWGGYWMWDPVENASLAPVAGRHCFPAFGHDAGKKGHDEGLEHGADLGHLLPVYLRDVSDAVRHRQLSPCVRANRPSVNSSWCSLLWDHRGHGVADHRPPRLS